MKITMAAGSPLIRRYAALLTGLALVALGSVFMINQSSLGLAPWDVLHVALFRKLGFTVGFWSTSISLTFIVIITCISRKVPQKGTILATILVGPLIDGFTLLQIVPRASEFAEQSLYFTAGTLIFACGTGMTLAADVGVRPRDEFMLIMVGWTLLPIRVVRTLLEVSVLIVGFALGGPVAAGTLFFSLLVGPVAQYTMKKFTPIVYSIHHNGK